MCAEGERGNEHGDGGDCDRDDQGPRGDVLPSWLPSVSSPAAASNQMLPTGENPAASEVAAEPTRPAAESSSRSARTNFAMLVAWPPSRVWVCTLLNSQVAWVGVTSRIA